MNAMSDELEWNETVECQHQACSGKRRYVVCKQGDVYWRVRGMSAPTPIETSRSNLGTPS